MTAPDTIARLRGAGLRVTRPRVATLDAVRLHPHTDTESVIRVVRSEHPEVSHQTVYDCLHALTVAGLLRRIQPSGSVARYETRTGDNHHHVICRSCRSISDVDCVAGDAPCLSPSLVGPGVASGAAAGYVIDEAEVVFWGLCPRCAQARVVPRPPEAVES